MDKKVKDLLALAYLSYGRGDAEFAMKAFLQSCESCAGDLDQVVQFLSAPVAAINSEVPVAENTLAPALHSGQIGEQPAACETVQPTAVQQAVAGFIDDGDEELEARAEAEDDIDEEEEDESEDEESDEESDDSEDEEEMQFSISSSTPVRLKERK